jgi:hypothetical protein
MPRKRKQTKNQIEFSDGKAKDTKQPDINDLLGFKQKNHFGTSSADELDKKLESSSLSELQAMAVTASIFPSGTKLSLKNKIKKAFKQFVAANGRTPTPRKSESILSPNSDAAKKFIEIMNG